MKPNASDFIQQVKAQAKKAGLRLLDIKVEDAQGVSRSKAIIRTGNPLKPKIECVDVRGVEKYLTKNKTYKVVETLSKMVYVVCDDGAERAFNKDRFYEQD